MRPRYVLKDDLLIDPCLDIVGNRLPNHFLDRFPHDGAVELGLLEAMAGGMNSLDSVPEIEADPPLPPVPGHVARPARCGRRAPRHCPGALPMPTSCW